MRQSNGNPNIFDQKLFDVNMNTSISKWGRKQWFNFLVSIIKEKKQKQPTLWAGNDYVPHLSGGLYKCWWGDYENTYEGYILYKQIEIECTDDGSRDVNLCYKVQTKKPENSSEQRPKIKKEILKQIKDKFREKKSDFKIKGYYNVYSTTYAGKGFTNKFSPKNKKQVTEREIREEIKTFILSDLY